MTCRPMTAPVLNVTFLFYNLVVTWFKSTTNYCSGLFLSILENRALCGSFAGAVLRRSSSRCSVLPT